MKFRNPYLSKVDRIELLQKWILIHSYLYYELDWNLVPDSKYDQNSLQLAKMIDKYPAEHKKSTYYYVFKDFDGSSGFGLFQKLNSIHEDMVKRHALYIKRVLPQ